MQAEDILKEICSSNGVSYIKLKQEAICCLTLELFYSGFDRIVGLENFTNLQSLYVIGLSIERVDGLQYVQRLKELCIAECNLKTTEGFSCLKYLQRLVLYSNQISKISNLDELKDLQILYLNNNKIASLQNFPYLPALKELNLAENQIDYIGDYLNHLQNIEVLQLSGNQLSSLKDLANLNKLSKLKHLGINSALYASCFISKLNYYFLFILIHFPQIVTLDDVDVSGGNIKELVLSLLFKKKSYYCMKKRLLTRNLELIKRNIKKLIGHLHSWFVSALNELKKNESVESEKKVQLVDDLNLIFEDVQTKVKKCIDESESQTAKNIHFLQLEFESLANIHLYDGTPSHNWYKACENLIQSRCCLNGHPVANIAAVRITKISKIQNTLSRAYFEELLASTETDNMDYVWSQSKQNANSKNIDYLFHINKSSDDAWQRMLLSLNTQQPMELQVNHLTNSLLLANAEFAETNIKGVVLLSKVYIGKSAECTNMQKAVQMFENTETHFDSLFSVANSTSANNCECWKRQFDWYIQKSNHILPEYLVQFEYEYVDKKQSQIETLLNSILEFPTTELPPVDKLKPIFKQIIDQKIQDDEDARLAIAVAIKDDGIDDSSYESEELAKILPLKCFVNKEDIDEKKVGTTICLKELGRNASVPITSLSMQLISQSLANANEFQLSISDNLKNITSVCVENQQLNDVEAFRELSQLRWASFNRNNICNLEGLASCVLLEELSMEHNKLTSLAGIKDLINLQQGYFAHNRISNIAPTCFDQLKRLSLLGVEANMLMSLAPFANLPLLSQLYISCNVISAPREVFYLKTLKKLVIFDLEGNPLNKNIEDLRFFVISQLKYIKVFNGEAVKIQELGLAKDMYGGILNENYLAESNPETDFSKLRVLDLPQASLSVVKLTDPELFTNLICVNLEHNNLTSFGSLIYLINLKVLCLNHNKVEGLFAKPKNRKNENIQSVNNYNLPNSIFPKLEVIHLCYNGIKTIAALQLNRMENLKAIFLQGNLISCVDSLDGLSKLNTLVLDKNKIKDFSEFCFHGCNKMAELHLEENRIKSIASVALVTSLKRLYIGYNKIQDISELNKLEPCSMLEEISFINNPVTKRNMHRPPLILLLPSLRVIDTLPINEDERLRVECMYLEQQANMSPMLGSTLDASQTRPNLNSVAFSNIVLVAPTSTDKLNWESDSTNYRLLANKPKTDQTILSKMPFSAVAGLQSKNINYTPLSKHRKR